MSEQEIKPVALEVNYKGNDQYLGDESHLIASATGNQLGLYGDHRLLTMNLDSQRVVIYEAISGNDRYPPGRNMHVEISALEFEAMIKIYQARLTRAEELKAAWKEKHPAETHGDDFDPFLDSDDLP